MRSRNTNTIDRDPLYQKWIEYLFARPETEPAWYFDIDLVEFAASPEQKVRLIGDTMLRCGTTLAAYGDGQVANGLKCIFDSVGPGISYLICHSDVAEALRTEAVLRMKHLYRDCFAKRCSSALSHLDEPGAGPLNGFCYMLWDVSPVRSWKDVVLEVMEDALYVPHNACIESALHGLGHRYRQDRQRVPEIIGRFLARTTALRPELKRYAERAAAGMVL
jgi:hypothetical protein